MAVEALDVHCLVYSSQYGILACVLGVSGLSLQ